MRFKHDFQVWTRLKAARTEWSRKCLRFGEYS